MRGSSAAIVGGFYSLWGFFLEDLFRIDFFIDYDSGSSRKHFFPDHVPVINSLVRIGIELVTGGVVEVSGNDQLRSLRHTDRFSHGITKLPVEVEVRHV